jgi:glycosyltransferase involved in cell wall biosynthesis
MRILIVSDHFPPEGNAAASRTSEHAARWAAAGHDVTVITSFPNWPEGKVWPTHRNSWRKEERMSGIRVIRVWTFIAANRGIVLRTIDYLSFLFTATLAAIGMPRPAIVVGTSPPFSAAVAAWLISGLKRSRFLFEIRDLWPESILPEDAALPTTLVQVLVGMELFLYSRADALVVVTEAFRRNLIERGVPADKVHLIRNGADGNRFSPRQRDEQLRAKLAMKGQFVAGYLGTFGVAQNLGSVLDAAACLRTNHHITFLMVGSGTEWQPLQDLIHKRQLANVVLMNQQPKERMPELWSCVDICLVPLSDSSVFQKVIPSKLFEAMAMGIPVLMAMPEGEATRIVREEGCGWVVPAGDGAALAAEIQRLAAVPQEVADMGRRSHEASRTFSREAAAQAMCRILEQTVWLGPPGR